MVFTPGGIDAPVKLYLKQLEKEIKAKNDMTIILRKSVLI